VLNVGTLDIKTENAGIRGNISITNAANNIGTLASSATSGTIGGDIVIVDGAGDLNISGNFANIEAGKFTTISTAGALTLAPGAALASGANADVVLAAGSGAFTNNAGASAVTPGTGGRFLIYSNAPATTTAGGLTGAPVYNKTFASNAPGTITQTGNRFLYSLAPTLTFTANNLDRLYGAANPTLTFTLSGLVGSDTAGQAYVGTPILSTTALATSDVGSYPISITPGLGFSSDYDYQFNFVPGTFAIDPAPLTITADNFSRSVGESNPTFTASFNGLVNGDTAADFPGLCCLPLPPLPRPPQPTRSASPMR
jgi:hypothetical protein